MRRGSRCCGREWGGTLKLSVNYRRYAEVSAHLAPRTSRVRFDQVNVYLSISSEVSLAVGKICWLNRGKGGRKRAGGESEERKFYVNSKSIKCELMPRDLTLEWSEFSVWNSISPFFSSPYHPNSPHSGSVSRDGEYRHRIPSPSSSARRWCSDHLRVAKWFSALENLRHGTSCWCSDSLARPRMMECSPCQWYLVELFGVFVCGLRASGVRFFGVNKQMLDNKLDFRCHPGEEVKCFHVCAESCVGFCSL